MGTNGLQKPALPLDSGTEVESDRYLAQQELQALQDELSAALRGAFAKHRQFITR